MTHPINQTKPAVLVVPAGDGIKLWVPEEPPKNLVDGEGPQMSTYTFMTTADNTGGALAVVDTVVPPGNGPPEHMHDDADESFYVLEGEFEIVADGESFHIKQGDFVFVPRGTRHIWKNYTESDGRLLRIYTPGGHEKFFIEIGRPAEPGKPAPRLTVEDVNRAEATVVKYYG
ncbi:mannose-6-phosphate isomerase-like protein (cupin superfamily) [Micromonospora pisi]|uniref:Mannose-6-phosphate isomerase-like protein (Cupin superfamily) n=1 Tax=Micromonospora pisi TaxID=589240 RepID=A0A495JPR4_9ACTN|nr:cupin domain-containing protein [Micromonospora pisi]RKR90374.1 mannose-6-phosphate isomerase-like protein (cupin superfamily) [Micromonospora pisi]